MGILFFSPVKVWAEKGTTGTQCQRFLGASLGSLSREPQSQCREPQSRASVVSFGELVFPSVLAVLSLQARIWQVLGLLGVLGSLLVFLSRLLQRILLFLSGLRAGLGGAF